MRWKELLSRAWHLTWSYRATWMLGAVLALTASQGLLAGYVWQRRDIPARNTLRLSPSVTFNFPGEGLSIDLTDPDGISVKVQNNGLSGIETMLGGIIPEGVRAVLLGALILGGLALLALVTARYVAEAGLIRMVAERERSGTRARLGQGWRWGWSVAAWRLLLIDLLMAVGFAAVMLLLLAIAVAPLLLWTTRNTLAGALGTALTSAMLVVTAAVAAVSLLSISIVVPVARRQSVLERLGVLASLRTAIRLVRGHSASALVVWLVWCCVRLAWALVAVPLTILFAPLALALLPVGFIVGGVWAVAVGGVLALFLKGAVPWIIGALAGLPLLALTVSAPWLLASAPVEVLKSSWWTLAVADLHLLPKRTPQLAPEPQVAAAVVQPAAVAIPAATKTSVPAAVPPAVTRKPATKRRAAPGKPPAAESKKRGRAKPKPAAKSKGAGRRTRVTGGGAKPRRRA